MNLEELDMKVMQGLKNFQKATVERVDTLFKNGQNRVLVADEVGLGKTLIARGVIVKLARSREEEGSHSFKVAYICANQNIAGQNILKLNVSGDAKVNNISDSRLSMQHLLITEMECEAAQKDQYIQLIPLTPDTSFRVSDGSGSVSERALIFCILKDLECIQPYLKEFNQMMADWAYKAWEQWAPSSYMKRVNDCRTLTNGKYPANIQRQFLEISKENGVFEELIETLRNIKAGETPHQSNLVGKLRTIFTEISIDMLQPDFVIMDEFQRFRSLIGGESQQSEATKLARRFLSSPSTRVLLLSATPYKLYSTMEEIEQEGVDDPYREFLQVTDFLFENRKDIHFREIWSDYSKALNVLQYGDTSILQLKQKAEDAMYSGICRTERISVMESGDYLDDSSCKNSVPVSIADIQSYLESGKLMQSIGSNVPIDYVKSCPFLLSFMQNYEIKKQVERYFKLHKNEISKVWSKILWVNKGDIESYRSLPKTNARLSQLQDKVFANNAEMLLWIPPTIPYYPLKGVWEASAGYSKTIVFSAWEMVPRMIGALISYESERRTVGELRKENPVVGDKQRSYFSEVTKRYPAPRLKLSTKDGIVRGKSLFCLIYPSAFLKDVFNPIDCINKRLSLDGTHDEVKRAISEKLDSLQIRCNADTNRVDERWYYLAPMLIDGTEHVHHWRQELQQLMASDSNDDKAEKKENESLLSYIDQVLQPELSPDGLLTLGMKPADLSDVLCDMALGSPAVCALRSLENTGYAGRLAKLFVNHFNTTEATSVVSLAYRENEQDAHWRNVLKYCRDGCIQAMLDEYIQLLSEDAGPVSEEQRRSIVFSIMQDALSLHSASYEFDTYSSMKNRVEGREEHKPSLRTGFAVGYVKGKGAEQKSTQRRESIRNAFNSPMRPFVLATTSIGQEGLDFHRYCRVVMHWNLPSNPIDLEQRQGRVNRYKCLAIRQNAALDYQDMVYEKNVWPQLFAHAEEEKTTESDLIPFWCSGKQQRVKIERLVPMYPLSYDQGRYERLIKILSLYRLTLGQARQEELLEYLLTNNISEETLHELFFDLSPFTHT